MKKKTDNTPSNFDSFKGHKDPNARELLLVNSQTAYPNGYTDRELVRVEEVTDAESN